MDTAMGKHPGTTSCEFRRNSRGEISQTLILARKRKERRRDKERGTLEKKQKGHLVPPDFSKILPEQYKTHSSGKTKHAGEEKRGKNPRGR